jgi:chromosomal replication initiator protein
MTPRPFDVPAILQRKITARWKEWEPWVWMDLLQRGIDPLGSSEIAALRQKHSRHIVDFMRTGLTMRLIRRHRLDDPRITDELRRVLSWAVMERRRDTPRGTEPSEIEVAPRQVSPSQYSSVPIDLIQKKVREYFQLRELRDQDLGLRSHRQIITFPRQLAMYIARQATGASLQEIGKQFGGRHHTTVLHSINKIERLRRSDEDLNRTITRLLDVPQ